MRPAIRELGPADLDIWAGLARALWPEGSLAQHRAEIARMIGPGVGGRRAFLAEAGSRVLGFAELGLRPYANGCNSQPVAFLDGIWVEEAARRQGIGRALLDHLSGVVRAAGGRELGSDALVGNKGSHAFHRAEGFAEVERVVCYRRDL